MSVRAGLLIFLAAATTTIIVLTVYFFTPPVVPAILVPTFVDSTSRHIPVTVQSRWSTVESSQKARLDLLDRQCSAHSTEVHVAGQPRTLMYLSDKYKFLYSETPKVACTNWKQTLARAHGAPDNLSVHTDDIRKYLQLFQALPESRQNYVLKNYFKFVFVRHPFERLVSAFRDKFEEHDYPNGNNVKNFIKQHYRNYNTSSFDPITFAEFVRYLVDPRAERPFDIHWSPYSELSQPCRIHFDFIGHYETLGADAEYVLWRIHLDQLVQLTSTTTTRKNSSDRVAKMFDQLPPEHVRQLREIYRFDFQLFGYE